MAVFVASGVAILLSHGTDEERESQTNVRYKVLLKVSNTDINSGKHKNSGQKPFFDRNFHGAGYGNRTRLHGLGSRCITDIRTLQLYGYYSRDKMKIQPFFVVNCMHAKTGEIVLREPA